MIMCLSRLRLTLGKSFIHYIAWRSASMAQAERIQALRYGSIWQEKHRTGLASSSVATPQTLEGPGEHDIDQSEDDEDLDEPDMLLSETAGQPLSVEAGSTDWEAAALAATQLVLTFPSLQGLQLYSYRTEPRQKQIFIALDKLNDRYGSPNSEDMETFQDALSQQLEATLGPAAGDLDIEASSPGAERAISFPGDLQRFADLPMKVQYNIDEAASGKQKCKTQILSFRGQTGNHTRWGLANVRANKGKGRAQLSKKQTQQEFTIPLQDLQKVNLHLDI